MPALKRDVLKKYGVDNVFKNIEIQNRQKETCVKKNGVGKDKIAKKNKLNYFRAYNKTEMDNLLGSY